MTLTSDVVVVGGGLVGLATASRLLEAHPELSVTVLEAEAGLARHQSGRNSGVVHSGVYYRPGSHKARLCREGAAELIAFCEAHRLPWRRTGKVIVATRPRELPQLAELHRRGAANGLEGLERLDPRGLADVEPHVRGLEALFVPQAGVVDFAAVARALAGLVERRGGRIRAGFTVVEASEGPREVRLVASDGTRLTAGHLVNCAGLGAERLARRLGLEPGVRLLPFRGSYFRLRRDHLIRHLVYPVPDPRFPFLGVHFTRRIDEVVEVGPNAVLALGAPDTPPPHLPRLRAMLEGLRGPEVHALARRYWRTGLMELMRSSSRHTYAASARRLVPELRAGDLRRAGSGIRAQAVRSDGTLVDDFVIVEGPRSCHVVNAPSPAATAALAIGREVAARVSTR